MFQKLPFLRSALPSGGAAICRRKSGLCIVGAVCLGIQWLCQTKGSASIVYSNPADISIPANQNGVYLNVEAGALVSEGGNWDLNLFYGGAAVAQSATFSFAGESGSIRNSNVYNLAYGSMVDAGSTFFSGFSGSDGHMDSGGLPYFENNETGYLGFTTTMGGTNVYGWMQVTLRDDGGAGTIHAWAWEDSGAGISVGAVPQPDITLTTGFAILSSLILRRRRSGDRNA